MQVTKAFLSADIPLYKLRNEHLKNLFKSMNHPAPSESACRSQVAVIFNEMMEKLSKIVCQKNIFIVFDETYLDGSHIANILIGLIEEPKKTYLVESKVFTNSLNANDVSIVVDQTLKNFSVQRYNLVLLLSDAARYMTAASKTLKVFYPNLFHVTYVSHLMHNAAEEVRASYPDVDRLISSVKATIVKNKTRRQLFEKIGVPPIPVLTLWGSWIEAAMFYSRNLPEVREIFNKIVSTGKLVGAAKDAIKSENLTRNLMAIDSQYSKLSTLAKEMEGDGYRIDFAIEKLHNLNFGTDDCKIKDYINMRLVKNEILAIKNLTNPNISPIIYSQLLKCPPTSASVERSFSMLNSIITKERNFNKENIWMYICTRYNSFML